MATQTQTSTGRESTVEQKIQQFRELFADAPPVGKTALENAIQTLTAGEHSSSRTRMSRIVQHVARSNRRMPLLRNWQSED